MTFFDQCLRAVSPSPARSLRSFADNGIAFGTDVGLKRQVNEDRVAVMRWRSPKSIGSGTSIAVVVSDGMGGMTDGAHCASLSVAHFLEQLLSYGGGDLTHMLTRAAFRANDAVYESYKGRGGATLTAIACDNDGNSKGVNIGDSRIYFSSNASTTSKLGRLTTDDNIKEAFGGHGDELIQFVGVGPGLAAHVIDIPDTANDLILTTDGVHFIPSPVFEEIINRAADPRSKVERALTLAKWLGAHDNATIACVNMPSLIKATGFEYGGGVELWTGSMDGANIWLGTRPSGSKETNKAEPDRENTAPFPTKVIRRRRQPGTKSDISPPRQEQLKIDIAVSAGKDDENDK